MNDHQHGDSSAPLTGLPVSIEPAPSGGRKWLLRLLPLLILALGAAGTVVLVKSRPAPARKNGSRQHSWWR